MQTERLWEVDSLRGIAIILMIISNLITDIIFFGIYVPDASANFLWTVFARVVVSMFILLAGVSLTLSYSRVKGRKPWEMHRKFFFRGLKIFSLGIIITLITWALIMQDFVLFGILHLIGFSIIFGHFLVKRSRLCLLLGVSFIIAGLFLQAYAFSFPWLVWLGLRPEGFFSVDYVPVLPWFGLFLVGIFMGNMLYPEGKRRFGLSLQNRLSSPLQFLGRNSLIIYFLHQPMLIAGLWLLFPFPHGLPI